MYNKTTIASAVNEVRYEMLASKCGGQTGVKIKLERKVDTSSLPPPRSCLNEHIRSVNYQVGIWRRAHIPKPIIPEATDDHGWVKRNGQIEPKWSAGDVIPPKLADVKWNAMMMMKVKMIAKLTQMIVKTKKRFQVVTVMMTKIQKDIMGLFYVYSGKSWSIQL
ncbi:hypothetical protein SNE40_002845 [Patella caerulea]|uniref:Uncharacterized protein n=1 Tax=Patella caerulea TaxID=87958 RepID=A0AAN8KCQ0_PATCE